MSDLTGAIVVTDNPYVLVEKHEQTQTPVISVSGMGVDDVLVACSFLIEMFCEKTALPVEDALGALASITYEPSDRAAEA